MGNPAFAVPALHAIDQSAHQLVAVVTGPDKPSGRGRRMNPPPVKEVAESLGYPVLQPPDLEAPQFHSQLRDMSADLFVVLAFRILPDAVLDIPPGGAINLHPSLLPAYRGAAPIRHALIRGEKITGLTTIAIGSRIDAGDILLQREELIREADDYGSLSGRLSAAGAGLLVETLDALAAGSLTPRSQDDDSGVPRAPRIGPEDMIIDWNQAARDIVNRIRAFDPAPGAATKLQGKRLKLFSASAGTGSGRPGLILERTDLLEVATLDGSVQCGIVQIEGKQRMPAANFLRGQRPEKGTVLG